MKKGATESLARGCGETSARDDRLMMASHGAGAEDDADRGGGDGADGGLEGGGVEEAGLFGDLVGLVYVAVDERRDQVSLVVRVAVHDDGGVIIGDHGVVLPAVALWRGDRLALGLADGRDGARYRLGLRARECVQGVDRGRGHADVRRPVFWGHCLCHPSRVCAGAWVSHGWSSLSAPL